MPASTMESTELSPLLQQTLLNSGFLRQTLLNSLLFSGAAVQPVYSD